MQTPKQIKTEQATQWLRTAAYSVVSLTGGVKGQDGKASGMRLVLRAKGTPSGILRECIEAAYLPEFSKLSEQAKVVFGMAESGPWVHLYSRWDVDRTTGELAMLRTFATGDDISDSAGMKISCGVASDISYYFDQASLIDMSTLEHANEQGWSFDRGGVRRDPNSNLYDYYVVISHRLTVVTAEHIAALSAVETTYAVEYRGLYGSQGDLKDHLGRTVVLPSGGEIRYEWSHDEEFCTWNVRVLRTVSRTVDKLREVVEDTTVAKDTARTRSGQLASLGEPTPASGGVSHGHTSELRPDGTWTNTVATKVEHLGDFAETKQVTPGYVASVQESVAAEKAPQPADDEVGKTVRNEKTLGKFFRTIITTYRAIVGFVHRKTKEENLFQSVVEEVTQVADEVPMEDFAGNGAVVRVEGSRDERGGWLKSRRVTQEKAVAKSTESVTGVPEGVVRTTEGILPEGDPSVATAGLNETYRKQNTPGKFVAFTRTIFEFLDRGRLTASRREDVSSIEQVTERAVPAWVEPTATFQKGRIVRDTCRLTDRGFRRSNEETTSVPYAGDSVTVSDDLAETVVATPHLEQSSVAPGKTDGRTVESVQGVSVTPFGRLNFLRVKRTLNKTSDAEHLTAESWDGKQYVSNADNDDLANVPSAGLVDSGLATAYRTQLERVKNAWGFFRWSKVRTEPVKRRVAFNWWQRGREVRQVLIFNYTEAEVAAERAAFPPGNIASVSHDVRPNEFGLFTGSITVAYDSSTGDGIGSIFTKNTSESKIVFSYDNGVMKAVKITYTVEYRKGYGLSYGLDEFSSGGSMEGSFFQQSGDNGYFYKKVTAVTAERDPTRDFKLSE